MEIKITKDNFEQEVLKSDIPVLVDFWAEWCPPCRMLSPIIGQIAEEYAGKIKVGKLNTDEEPELAAMFRVDSIPRVFLFKEGKPAGMTVGYMPKENLIKELGL